MLMPWARTGLMGWAASPRSKRPGLHQLSANPTCTLSRVGLWSPVPDWPSQLARSGGHWLAKLAIHSWGVRWGVGSEASKTQPSWTPPVALSNRLKTP